MRIEKALIPVAGMGTRMLPLTAAMPKALLPLADDQGNLRAAIDWIVREALSAVTRVGLVVSPSQLQPLQQYFAAASSDNCPLEQRIDYIIQHNPAGFGDAVLLGRSYIGNAPFMVMLGDHVHLSASQETCARQVSAEMARPGAAAVIGMQRVDEQELPRVGTAAGEQIGDNLYRCTAFIEKPSIQQARAKLTMPGLPTGKYLAHCGIYAFCSEIFDHLADLSARPRNPDQEVQLADAQSLLLERRPCDYYLLEIKGQSLDIGTPEGYIRAWQVVGRRS